MVSNNKKYIYHILKDENEIIEYEKQLYLAYGKNPNNWTFRNYLKNENRLRPNIPYEDQIIYVVKGDNNKILSGITIHVNSENEYIAEKMGFKIDEKRDSCEGLTMFIIDEEIWNIDIILKPFCEYVLEDLKKRGFKKFYAAPEKKHKRIHVKLFGWKEVLGTKIIKNEQRFLLFKAEK